MKLTDKRVPKGTLTLADLRSANEGSVIKIIGLGDIYSNIKYKTNPHNGKTYEVGMTLNRKICESAYEFLMDMFSKNGISEPNNLCIKVMSKYSVDDLYDALLDLDGIGHKSAVLLTIAITGSAPSVIKHLASEIVDAIFIGNEKSNLVYEAVNRLRCDDYSTAIDATNASELVDACCREALDKCEDLRKELLPDFESLRSEVKSKLCIVPGTNLIMAKSQYDIEQDFLKLCKKKVTPYMDMDEAERVLTDMSDGADILHGGLDDYQYAAVKMVMESDSKVVGITGKAGSGKSHAITASYRIYGGSDQCTLTAYQNKACDVLSRRVGGYHFGGKGIKSLMSLSMTLDSNKKFAALFSSVMLVIVDESSQIGTRHLKYIMNIMDHAHRDAKLVLTGDVLQTRPVCTYGLPFRHAVNTGIIPTCDLGQFHRTNGLGILKLCEHIRSATNGTEVEVDSHSDGVELDQIPNDNIHLQRLFRSIASDYIDAGDDIGKFMVIAETNTDCKMINTLVAATIYADEDGTRMPRLHEGMPVVSTANMAARDCSWTLCNGARFVIKSIDSERVDLIDRYGAVSRIPLCSLDRNTLVPAYAITVHKSQGDEARNVRYVFRRNRNFENAFFCDKTMKYVAFSRAQETLTLNEIYDPGEAPSDTITLRLNDCAQYTMSF